MDSSTCYQHLHSYVVHLQIESASDLITEQAKSFIDLGVSSKDALHVASAIARKADYFIATDDRLINKLKHIEQISVVNPITLAGYLNEHDN